MSDREHESDPRDMPVDDGGSTEGVRNDEPTERRSSPVEDAAEGPTLGAVLAEIEAEVGAVVGGSKPGSAPGAPGRSAEAAGLQVLLFSQGGNRFAVEIESVLEVGPVPEHTWVPGVPGWVRGVANFRGEIISIVALGELLGLEQGDSSSPSRRMLVAQARGGPVRSGLIVDGVHGNLRLSREQIRPLAAPVHQGIEPYLSGLLEAKGELHALLDIERLLLSDTFRALGSVRRRQPSHVV